MDKKFIIAEIQRVAAENGGVAPGRNSFEKATGISVAKWRGKYWISWSDAIREAGLSPNKLKKAIEPDHLLRSLAKLTIKLGKLPTHAHMLMERRIDPDFPSYKAFERLGSITLRIEALRKFAEREASFKDVLLLLPSQPKTDVEPKGNRNSSTKEGFVYLGLLKVGTQKRYKIGKTNLIERRSTELSLQLPEKIELVHAIKTDDMAGIEEYWHKRFASKHTNGEWFSLSVQDVRAFKLRKFM